MTRFLALALSHDKHVEESAQKLVGSPPRICEARTERSDVGPCVNNIGINAAVLGACLAELLAACLAALAAGKFHACTPTANVPD